MRNSFSRSDLSMMPMRVLRLPQCAIDCRYHDSRDRGYPHECGMTTVRSLCDGIPRRSAVSRFTFTNTTNESFAFRHARKIFMSIARKNPAPATAGYSGKPLWQKLGLKPGLRVRLSQAPDDYFSLCDFDAAQ